MLAICTFVACGKNEEPDNPNPELPEINIDIPDVTLPEFSEGGESSTQIIFYASAPWILELSETKSVPSWFDVTPKEGGAGDVVLSVTITEENTEYEDRNAYIKIKSGTAQKIITVTQKKKDALLVSKDKFEIDPAGGDFSIEVKSNVDYSIEIPEYCSDWIVPSIKSKSLASHVESFHISPGSTDGPREGSVIFSSGPLSDTVYIYQARRDELILSDKIKNIDERAQTFDVELRSNIEYDVSIIGGDWLQRASVKSIRVDRLTFTAAENTDHDNRTLEVVVKDRNSTLADTLTVTQAQKNALIISKKEYVLDQSGGVVNVELKTNIEYDIIMPANADWLTKIETKALNTYNHKFNVAANPIHDNREAQIIFRDKKSQLRDTITITQGVKNDILIGKSEYDVSFEAGKLTIDVQSNVTYQAAVVKGNEWISLVKPVETKGLESSSVEVEIAGNYNAEPREGAIEIKNVENNLACTVKITQAGAEPTKVIHIAKAGTLSELYTRNELAKFSSLKFTGEMNRADGEWVSRKPGIDFAVRDLDLSEVTFSYGDVYGFTLLKKLRSVKFPENIHTIGINAFLDCSLLETIDWGTNSKLQILDGGIGFDIFESRGHSGAFNECKSLKSVDIPASVTKIRVGAFAGCSQLSQVNISPNSQITSFESAKSGGDHGGIGLPTEVMYHGMFYGCDQLKTITIPKSVTSISKAAFKEWSGLESIEIPETVLYIDTDELFKGCAKLKSVKLPRSVTKFGNNMFQGCASLTDLTTATLITSVGDYAFAGCGTMELGTIIKDATIFGKYCFALTGIKEFTAPQFMTEIPEGMFNESKIEKLSLGNLIQKIGKNAFAYCKSLNNVTIPSSVTIIEDEAFAACPSLTNFNLTGGNIVFGDYVFRTCVRTTTEGTLHTPLTSLYIPKEIISIKSPGSSALALCPSLKEIIFEDGSQCTEFGICGGMEGLESITLPNSIKKLSPGAFEVCQNLRQITLPDNLTEISKNAFRYCKKLSNITLPASVEVIGDYAFENAGLISISIPEKVKAITYLTFKGCTSLSDVELKTVETLDYSAFRGCTKLRKITLPATLTIITNSDVATGFKEVICLATNPPQLQKAFVDEIILYVPAQSVAKYQEAWQKYLNISNIREILTD